MPATQTVRRLAGAAVLLLAASALGACTISKHAAGLEPTSELVTASISKSVKAEGVDSTDTEVIKNLVAGVDQGKNDSAHLAWSNPETGSRGTITAIDHFVGSHGQKCKKFETTLDSFMGISLYDGETCELREGFWVLSWFLRKDK
jgi:hypothetical protein